MMIKSTAAAADVVAIVLRFERLPWCFEQPCCSPYYLGRVAWTCRGEHSASEPTWDSDSRACSALHCRTLTGHLK